MIACLSAQHLERVLAGQLTAEEEEQVAAHLQNCSHCQAQLEQVIAAHELNTLDVSCREAGGDAGESSFQRFRDTFLGRRQRAENRNDEDESCVTTPRRDLVSDQTGGPGRRMPCPLPLPYVPGYLVLEELGHGGLGVVYRAQHVALKRVVALKMLRRDIRSTMLNMARFRREAETLARLLHPHVVQVYDIGETEG